MCFKNVLVIEAFLLFTRITKEKAEAVSSLQSVRLSPKLKLHSLVEREGSWMRNVGRPQNKHLLSAAIYHALDKAEMKLLQKISCF